MGHRVGLAGLVLGLGLGTAQAQLAITEAMSSASTNLGQTLVGQNSDWWELTNFGTNTVDLTGYRWNDNAGGLMGADPTPFVGLTIGPGESIIFCESNAPPGSGTPEQFRAWWGPGLNPNVKIVFYTGNGLGSGGDGIRLWGPWATSDADVVDSVDFGAAVRGRTFTYNPVTGEFGWLSTNGIGGAFKAATADDEGSPGVTTGPVPLAILQHPTNVSVNPGDNAVFAVTASGLPRPTYQWQFNGVDIPGARFRTLTVSNVQPDKVGEYRVLVSNGLTTLVSSNATLALNVMPEPPRFVLSPRDQNVFIGQRIRLLAQASGVPAPTFHWFRNGLPLPGVTGGSLIIANAQLSDAGLYAVVASNALGRVTNMATVVVTRRPRLVITEILPAQSTNGPFRGHNDWWELTNYDDFTVDLKGYRFDDNSATLAAAVTFTNELRIAPGESIVFVEGMTVSAFRSWWGPFLGTNIQIVTYQGSGLGLSSLGDAVNLWNAGAEEDFDTIASEVFSTATPGVSFRFDPDAGVYGELSREGWDGAWVAPENGDIGSPGYTRNPPEPRILRFEQTGRNLRLTWTAETNVLYTVQVNTDLRTTNWTSLFTAPSPGAFMSYTAPISGSGSRFYRVQRGP